MADAVSGSFLDLAKWQKNQTVLAATTNSTQYAFLNYNTAKETPSVFDFMQGKDTSNPNDYKEQLYALAQSDMNRMDADGDGKISVDEYIMDGISDLAGLNVTLDNARNDGKQINPGADLLQTAVDSNLLFLSLDTKEINGEIGDGFVDLDELAKFYENVDKFNDSELGQFNSDDFTDYVNSELSQYYPQELTEEDFVGMTEDEAQAAIDDYKEKSNFILGAMESFAGIAKELMQWYNISYNEQNPQAPQGEEGYNPQVTVEDAEGYDPKVTIEDEEEYNPKVIIE